MSGGAPALAIVVLPDANDMVQVDIAGRPAGQYVFEELKKLENVEVRVLADESPAPASEAASNAAIAPPIGPLEAQAIGDTRIVLVLDGRAWLPRAALEAIISRATASATVCRVVDSERNPANPIGRSLAVCFPHGFDFTFERRRTAPGRALDSVLSVPILEAATPIASSQLNPLGPALFLESLLDIAALEGLVSSWKAQDAMRKGVRIRDSRQIWLRGEVTFGSGVELDINVIVEGGVIFGNDIKVGANCVLRDCELSDRVRVHPFSLIEGARIGIDSVVGPFGRIRPRSSIGEAVQIGNYVEIKNSEIGPRSRINHHAFIGDALLGADVTIGAGTITCNHDGVRINRTIIERGAYVGSNCSLVAPVRIGEGATVGAGSTITSDVPPAKLTLARAKQTTIDNWHGPRRS